MFYCFIFLLHFFFFFIFEYQLSYSQGNLIETSKGIIFYGLIPLHTSFTLVNAV